MFVCLIFTGSGDVFSDMSSQIDANAIRIDILQKENDALRKALKTVGSPTDSNSSQDRYSDHSLSTTRSDIPAWSDFHDDQVGHNITFHQHTAAEQVER